MKDAARMGGIVDQGARSELALRAFAFLFIMVVIYVLSAAVPSSTNAARQSQAGAGELAIVDRKGAVVGECPLKHTDVQAAITGNVARVTVSQEFANTSSTPVEAVYTFPLPENSAVDRMQIKVGTRTIKAVIRKRDEARQQYEQARDRGQVAALLDQERPNIFTQSVANITPGASVSVEISYLQPLKYEEGHYEFFFPMTVAPRYMPGMPTGASGGGWSPDTTRVPDASRISPPVAVPGTRAGHDVSLAVQIDAGVPITNLRSVLHKIVTEPAGIGAAKVHLARESTIPNRDFILRYDTSADQMTDALLTHRGQDGNGYFALLLQPPARFRDSDVTPKEMVFVLDTSGSMSGFPIEKGKELILRALDGLNANDTFNVITFAGDTHILFPEPVFPTAANIEQAKQLIESRAGGGGTEMMKAIHAALSPSGVKGVVRIVCFVTDGEVGNDMEIVSEVQKNSNARVFSFGIGSSVNRFLLEKMAHEGRGESEIVTLREKADGAVDRMYERVRAPLLTDISIDWGGLNVSEVYPSRPADLFAAKPLVIYGRYQRGGRGTMKLKGMRAGQQFEREIPVTLPDKEPDNDSIATLWARQKVEARMADDWLGLQRGSPSEKVKADITQLGLEYRLMTPFTSFVAIDEQISNAGGKQRTVQVPVEMPQGMSYKGVFGADTNGPMFAKNVAIGAGGGGGVGSGYAGGVVGGVMSASPIAVPQRVMKDEASYAKPKPVIPADPEEAALSPKAHPAVISAWKCALQKPGVKHTCTTTKGQKLEVVLVLAAKGANNEASLKNVGFEVKRSAGNTVTGFVPVELLPKLASLEAVKFISLARKP